MKDGYPRIGGTTWEVPCVGCAGGLPPCVLCSQSGGPGQRLVARPRVVVLCGSTRFYNTFREQNLRLTLEGVIVLSIGVDTKSDADVFKDMAEEELHLMKEALDELHMRKIDLADSVLVLNVGGYIGESTRREIQYAALTRTPVEYLEAVE